MQHTEALHGPAKLLQAGEQSVTVHALAVCTMLCCRAELVLNICCTVAIRGPGYLLKAASAYPQSATDYSSLLSGCHTSSGVIALHGFDQSMADKATI